MLRSLEGCLGRGEGREILYFKGSVFQYTPAGPCSGLGESILFLEIVIFGGRRKSSKAAIDGEARSAPFGVAIS